MISERTHFEISFPTIPVPVADAWMTIVSCLEHNKCLPKQFYVSQIAGHKTCYHSSEKLTLSACEIAALISARDLEGFGADTGHSNRSVAYELTAMKNTGGQSVLNCRIENSAKSPSEWNQLIEALIIQWPSIGGWQWGNLYNRWQNTGSLEYYESWFGPKPDALPTYKKEGIHEWDSTREFPDNSKNPGRRKEMIPGIQFYPTAEMWLGPHFWQHAKCTKEEVLAADFFIEKRDTPHFLYLKSWPQPFSRPDGEQGRQQQRIWKLFFNEDCEWPPGSGTICDEPMYGPPELMP